MKSAQREARPGILPLFGVLVLLMSLAAAGLRAETRPESQEQSGAAKCANAGRPSNPAAEAASRPMTEAQGAAILRELRAIRLLLQNGAAPRLATRQAHGPRPAKMRIEPGWYALGSPNAPVTMIEFVDLQCPFCRRFQTAAFPELKRDYIDTGKVRFISRNLPLPMHAYALGAAEAAYCAGDQGKFWQFRDAVLDDQVPPTLDVLSSHARDLGLSLKRFQACLSRGKYKVLVQADRADASALGIHGVPGFVIGRAEGGWIDGVSMQGARPFPFFQSVIEKTLSDLPPGSAANSPARGRNPAEETGAGTDPHRH